MVIRFQMGPFGDDSWRCLNLSLRLMRRLEPCARLVVTYQGNLRGPVVEGVEYHEQEAMYSHGRYFPARYDITTHEVWLENDHVMWALPPAWGRFRQRTNVSLVWLTDWAYHGSYATAIGDFLACPGMYGLPPGVEMEALPEEQWGQDQEEQGWVASWLLNHGPHEVVTHAEVSCYMPAHPILGATHGGLGTCGTHFAGLNRGWNAPAVAMIAELERRYL